MIILRYRFYFFSFMILNTDIPLLLHAKLKPNIPSGSVEVVDNVFFLLFSVTAAILIIRPDSVLQF